MGSFQVFVVAEPRRSRLLSDDDGCAFVTVCYSRALGLLKRTQSWLRKRKP